MRQGKRDFLTFWDLTRQEVEEILLLSRDLKEKRKRGIVYEPLKGKMLAMIFEKASTRTRVSFEVGMRELGGHSLFLSPSELQIGRGESISDTARVLSRYVDCIIIRSYSQELVEEFAINSEVPVINGLTNKHHPCQVLGDIFTIWEKKSYLQGIKVAYVGDGNNVAHSLIQAASLMDFNLTVACPDGYEPDQSILKSALEKNPGSIRVIRNPFEAVSDADVIYTDVWTSMGWEEEAELRRKIFRGYQVNMDLVSSSKKDVIVMHCLPAHRGEEITSDVMDGSWSVILDQAENRLHTQKALIIKLIIGF